MSENYLQHYGILGMKWGKRNGPPYPLTGKQMSSSERKAKRTGKYVNATPGKTASSGYRKASEMSDQEPTDFNKRKGLEKQYNKYTKGDENKKWENVKQVANLVDSTINQASRSVDDAYRDEHRRKKNQIDLSHLSDDELRKIVNRLNMERQYRDLLPDDISQGEVVTKKVLAVLGTASTAALAAIGVVAMIKSFS